MSIASNLGPSRIVVAGPSGAGKSTMASRLGRALDLPVVHLDREYWQPGWIEPPKDEWLAKVRALVARDQWVMDGNFSGTFAERVVAADVIILMTLPRLQCIWRLYRRAFRYLGKVRPDLAPGCPEKWPSPEFLLWVWNYPKRSLPKMLRTLDEHARGKTVRILRSHADAEQYISEVERTGVV